MTNSNNLPPAHTSPRVHLLASPRAGRFAGADSVYGAKVIEEMKASAHRPDLATDLMCLFAAMWAEAFIILAVMFAVKWVQG